MTKRERIFHAGTKLFAAHTYDAVGIRDIAEEAGVNSAMISYYYGGKFGLLREIFACFCQVTHAVAVDCFARAADHQELCSIVVTTMLESARANRDLYLVGLRQLNRSIPELRELKDELQRKSWKLLADFQKRLGLPNTKTDEEREISFSAIMGMVFSDYLLGGGEHIDDDDKLATYEATIKQILIHGLPSMAG